MKQLGRRVILLCALLSLAAACDRTGRATSQTPLATPQTAAGQTTAERPRPQPLSLRGAEAPTPAARTAPEQPAPTPPAATPSTGAELLETDRPSRIAPRDFKIGELWLPAEGQGDARGVLAVFLEGLVRGEVVTDLLEIQSRDRLVRSLEYYRGNRPERFRIGILEPSADGGVLANVRLFGTPGVAEGEIYLVRAEEGWKVADLQVGFAMLDTTYTPPTEPYVPSTYEYRRTEPSGGE